MEKEKEARRDPKRRKTKLQHFKSFSTKYIPEDPNFHKSSYKNRIYKLLEKYLFIFLQLCFISYFVFFCLITFYYLNKNKSGSSIENSRAQLPQLLLSWIDT